MTFKFTKTMTASIVALAFAGAMTGVANAQAVTQDTAPAPQASTPTTVPATPPTDATATTDTTAAPAQAAPAQAQASAGDPAAKDFMHEAFMANEFGIAAAQVAQTNAKSPAVKSAAAQVLANDTKTRQDMIAAIQGSTSDMHFDQTWNDDYTQRLADLKSAKGAEFDAKYVATQSEVNTKAAGLAQTYAASGTDATVKDFAAKTAPTLQADAQALQSAAPAPAAK